MNEPHTFNHAASRRPQTPLNGEHPSCKDRVRTITKNNGTDEGDNCASSRSIEACDLREDKIMTTVDRKGNTQDHRPSWQHSKFGKVRT
jgi:hypothetical protein